MKRLGLKPFMVDVFLHIITVILVTSAPVTSEWYIIRCSTAHGEADVALIKSIVHLSNGTVSLAVSNTQSTIDGRPRPLMCTTRQAAHRAAPELPCPLEKLEIHPQARWTFFGNDRIERRAVRAMPKRGTLSIRNLSDSDIGRYVCKVTLPDDGEIEELWDLKKQGNRWVFVWKSSHGMTRTFWLKKRL
ncbi:uncharacterized protein LOC111244749 [Varroa destructor]|uniref:Ig-like domain-containing protein n=1 Tax=Varroa destructor TaxID=109461 RepID=A0A7M7J7D4_VARDE|nr:uncharacterized protein LOC111244749 [Varroa destructor]